MRVLPVDTLASPKRTTVGDPNRFRRRRNIATTGAASAVAAAWLKRYGVEMQEGPSKMLQGYIDRGHNIFSTLIDHPAVANAGDVRACSIVLQRGIIVLSSCML